MKKGKAQSRRNRRSSQEIFVELQDRCYNGGSKPRHGEKGRTIYAHKLQTAMAYADRAQYAERGLAACRRSYHKYDCQYGEGKAYQHGNADEDL